MKVEVAVLGSPSLIVLVVSVDLTQSLKKKKKRKKKKTKEDSCPDLRSCVEVEVAVLATPVLNSPYGLCGRKGTFEEVEEHSGSERRSCVKVEVAVQGSPSLIVLVVSMDVTQH